MSRLLNNSSRWHHNIQIHVHTHSYPFVSKIISCIFLLNSTKLFENRINHELTINAGGATLLTTQVSVGKVRQRF